MNQPDTLTVRGYVHARLGQEDEARRMLARLDEPSASRAVSSFHKAAIYVGLGEHDRALDLLEQAAEERAWQMRLLKVDPPGPQAGAASPDGTPLRNRGPVPAYTLRTEPRPFPDREPR